MRRVDVERCHHASSESARTADVGVGNDSDVVVGHLIDIEGASVVDDEHMEALCDGFVAGEDLLFHFGDVAEDELLLFERGGCQGEFDGADAVLVDLGVVVGAAEGCRSCGCKNE